MTEAITPVSRTSPVPRMYALADADALRETPLERAVAEMAGAGVRWIQVRAKGQSDLELARTLAGCCEAVEGLETELWINDRPDLARLFPVRGVHLGQADLPPAAARSCLDESVAIGCSTHNEEQVASADADPNVDRVAIGPVFTTESKRDTEPTVGLEGVRRARQLTDKPLIAIGGIDASNLVEVFEAGADTVAMLSAVVTGDITQNCNELLTQVAKVGEAG